VKAFIDLVERHEQSFYSFVHKVHSKGEGLFDSLMRWVELFLTVAREGLGEPISLEFLLPHKGQERADILAEVDKVAQYHYKLKVLYEDKLRRRFGRAQSNEADAEDEATHMLVNGVMGEISFGDLVQGDAMDLAAEDEEEETSSGEDDEYSSSEYETSSDAESNETEENARKAVSRPHLTSSPRSPSHPGSSKAPERHSRTTHRNAPHGYTNNMSAASSSTTQISTQGSPTEVPKRKRSFSLHRSRSMNFSLGNLSLSRRSNDIPPVPPLPAHAKVAYVAPSKPLPPSPTPDNDYDDSRPPPVPPKPQSPRTQALPQQSISTANPAVQKKKFVPQAIRPPDLKHIPQLLPVFVEMVSSIDVTALRFHTYDAV